MSILMDSITRLARANNQVVPTSGRLLSGGLDPRLYTCPNVSSVRQEILKQAFNHIGYGAGSTGSRLDDIIYGSSSPPAIWNCT